mmetsp:Transcript_12823/g.26524  ORF Transcript_12823/g.26524 Transcript_12823/m.26524 type:complete len:220 (-) Transcript_12823:2471-3130(-)
MASEPSMQMSSPSTPTSAPPMTSTISFSFGWIRVTSLNLTVFVEPSSSVTNAVLSGLISLITAGISSLLSCTQTLSMNHTAVSSPSPACVSTVLLCCSRLIATDEAAGAALELSVGSCFSVVGCHVLPPCELPHPESSLLEEPKAFVEVSAPHALVPESCCAVSSSSIAPGLHTSSDMESCIGVAPPCIGVAPPCMGVAPPCMGVALVNGAATAFGTSF